jgi:Phosphotransferase enzyme family
VNARETVYWCGKAPDADDREPLRRYQLSVTTIRLGNRPDFSCGKALVVNAVAPSIPEALAHMSLVREALNHGCLVYLLAENDTTFSLLKSAVDNLEHESLKVYTCPSDPWKYVRVIDRYNPGPGAAKNLEIHTSPADEDLTEETELLIRRAFSDAVELHLDPLAPGRSGAHVYQAEARLRKSEAGPRPMPFFVKIGDRDTIAAERRNYDLYATIHVPYHLRPNLIPERCVIGTEHALIVGNFVDNSRSLWEVARSGAGAAAIHSLFEETLKGWRLQGYERDPAVGRVGVELDPVLTRGQPLQSIVERAAEFGAVLDPQELRANLLNLGEAQYVVGPCHGDLHGENVRVRGNDAILLDLARVHNGPICTDIAHLEVWLSCEQMTADPDPLDFETWGSVMELQVRLSAFSRPPKPGSYPRPARWLEDCVRQTRMLASSICMSNHEYAIAIVIHLAARARHLHVDEGDEGVRRRAYCYFLASRLVDELRLAEAQS